MAFNFSLNLLKFEDVRAQIVEFLQSNSEFSGQFDFTSSNIGLNIDTMAYVTMLMSYQVSNTANNLFLDTTTLRKNAISIAKTMGFRPRRSVGSRVTGTIEYYDPNTFFATTHNISIPALSTFISDGGYQYVNYNEIVLTVDPYDSHLLKSSVILYEGTEKTYTYLGNGLPFQTFTIPSAKIDENNFNLYVKKNDVTNSDGLKWGEVKQSFNLIDKNSYFVEEDLNTEGYTRIVFGDNDITNYPSNNEIVTVKYIETNATVANGNTLIKINTTNFVYNTPGASGLETYFKAIDTTTSKSYGAKEIETLEEIQARCPKAFATVGGAVTENDYKTLLQEIGGLYKSNSIGGDKLFPSNADKLGNIYLTGIPSIDSVTGNIYESMSKIFLSAIEENEIYTTLNRYRIIATQLNFMKPSYVSVVIKPEIETKANTNQSELDLIKTNIGTSLQSYFTTAFNNFAQSFRSSKINGLITDVSGVVSSKFTTDYSFALCKDCFYDVSSFGNNMIYLPVIIKAKDQFGNVTEYDNFVKTNEEQKQLLGKTELEPTETTINGKIANLNVDRRIYSQDTTIDGNVETADLLLDGKNVFFNLYRFESDYTKNETTNLKTFNVGNTDTVLSIVNPSVSAVGNFNYDDYPLYIDDNFLGTVKRTYNREYGFKGLIDKEGDITSSTNGSFYEAVTSFSISGTDKTFTGINVGDIIIYNASLTGDKWIKTTDKGFISAIDDSMLFSLVTHNSIYIINTDGDFNGKTPYVSGGDYIIFNLNSVNPYKWDVLNMRNDPTENFDATTPFVKEVVDYEMKRVINTYLGQTTFGDRTNAVSEDDLIYYDPIEPVVLDRWKRICNVALSGDINYMDTIDSLPVTGGSLELFNYATTGLAIGTAYRVTNIGNFGESRDRINWPSYDDTAFDGDVILYVGDGRWNLWQDSQPDTFNIDGTIVSSLPMTLTYGDMFLVSVSGDFNGSSSKTYKENDFVVYSDNNTWIPLTVSAPITGLDASGDNLPKEATLGDVYTVKEDGVFNNSYMVSPQGDSFVQGDKVIYTGTTYTKLNEYTFEYNNTPPFTDFYTSRDYINELGLNSIFNYKYNYTTKFYDMFFHDMFHGLKLGTFRYTGSSITSMYDIGKIIFEPYITGSFNLQDITEQIGIDQLFDDTTVNKISFIPKNKKDVNGNLTTIQEDNFDTVFNTYVIMNSDVIGITK